MVMRGRAYHNAATEVCQGVEQGSLWWLVQPCADYVGVRLRHSWVGETDWSAVPNSEVKGDNGVTTKCDLVFAPAWAALQRESVEK